MQIYGAKSLSQQAYALLKTITSSHKEGEIYYWLVESDHLAQVATETVLVLAKHLNHKIGAFYLDPTHAHFGASLKALLDKTSGVYVMTVETYAVLNRALSLISEKSISVSVGQSMTPQNFKKRLLALGYTNHEEDSFSFSVKGESLILREKDDETRIVFAIDKIESIVSLSSKSAQSALEILPAEINLEELSALDIKKYPGSEVYSDQLGYKSDQKEKNFIFQTFENTTDEELEKFDLHHVAKYKRDFGKLAMDLNQFMDHGYAIVIATIDEQVIKTALHEAEVEFDDITFIEQFIPLEGFIDRKEKYVLLTHSEIFGRKEVKKQKRRDNAAFVTKLQINDYIVHEDHGIGRYLGLTETEIEGYKRENLILEYANGDKLYVPVELAYKVDKYIGEAKPKLQRLSGTSWIRLSRKASQESQEFARDLLKLYAQRSLISVPSWQVYLDADKQLHESFPYQETPDQEQAINDVYTDLQKPTPMDRLVVGDVGFGKTEVAIRATYQAVLNHKQVAVLCPTTLLAQQHYDTFSKRLKGLGVNIEMLSRFTGKVGKDSENTSITKVVEGVKNGSIDIVIGTHRLLSKDVNFDNMGLVIVDEEQRFGVRHKEKLKSLRSHAHILTLSATPIPRTLYFSISGLRDISTIQTPPKGRQPIITKIHEYDQDIVKKSISDELKRGGQAFYLYNRVQTITTMKRKLQELLGAKVKIDIVHGQMPPSEMARVASEFGAGKIDVLVCTTIVENGLDLPNVNTLIVHNATRYGIGQLYQIRGRIGRGTVKAHALFLYPEAGISGVAATRLQILEEAKELGSGFQLAMRDLEMRGMGQMLGKQQHGQIQKVGLSLYGKLLRQAVEELETGEIQKQDTPVNINLPINYGLPNALISEPSERLKLYRLLSQAISVTDLDESLDEYQDQIDQLPIEDREQLNNLKSLLGLKFLARSTPIIGVDYQQVLLPDGMVKKQIELTFTKLRPQYVDLLIPYIPDFKIVGDNKVIYPVNDTLSHIEQISAILKAFDDK